MCSSIVGLVSIFFQKGHLVYTEHFLINIHFAELSSLCNVCPYWEGILKEREVFMGIHVLVFTHCIVHTVYKFGVLIFYPIILFRLEPGVLWSNEVLLQGRVRAHSN